MRDFVKNREDEKKKKSSLGMHQFATSGSLKLSTEMAC